MLGSERPYRRVSLCQRLFGDRRDDLFLAAEIPVERACGQPCVGEDVLHRRLVESVAGEAAAGRVEDLLAALLSVGVGDSGHGGEHKTNIRS